MDLIKGPLMSLKGPLWASGCPGSQPGSPLIKPFLPPLFSARQWELVGASQAQGGGVCLVLLSQDAHLHPLLSPCR